MISFQFENLPAPVQAQVISWLTENYGNQSQQTWYIDYQPMIEDLILSESIATAFALKWL